jgi:hypothetical protein
MDLQELSTEILIRRFRAIEAILLDLIDQSSDSVQEQYLFQYHALWDDKFRIDDE